MYQVFIPEEQRQFVFSYQTWGFSSEMKLLNQALLLLKKNHC